MNAPRSPGSDPPAELAEAQRDLMAATQHAREEAGRPRRLAETQTQAEVIGTRGAMPSSSTAKPSCSSSRRRSSPRSSRPRRLARDIKQMADEARAKLQQMADRLKRPPLEG
jgi:hypothetical protein